MVSPFLGRISSIYRNRLLTVQPSRNTYDTESEDRFSKHASLLCFKQAKTQVGGWCTISRRKEKLPTPYQVHSKKLCICAKGDDDAAGQAKLRHSVSAACRTTCHILPMFANVLVCPIGMSQNVIIQYRPTIACVQLLEVLSQCTPDMPVQNNSHP